MEIKDIIKRKRDKKELTEEEIRFFIFKYFKQEILEEQAASLLTLMYTNGLTEKEVSYLTKAMAETGTEIELYRVSNKIVDIHAIGGIQDKIIIMLISIIASLGIPIVKVAGRELGLMDRLNSINTFNGNIKYTELNEIVDRDGMAIINEPENMVPIENKLYKLRNTIACNDNISLIAMSIMSQKIAIGAKNIIFDITCGENAYVKTYPDAIKMAKELILNGKRMNRNVKCMISKMNEPIGYCFGNIIEIKEIVQALRGKMADDVLEMIIKLGTQIISLSGISNNYKQNENLIIQSIKNGEAYTTFLKLVQLENDSKIFEINAKNKIPIISNENGIVEKINIDIVRNVATYLNAIRKNPDDMLDIGAGIEFVKKVGDEVKVGEVLAYIYTNNEVKISQSVQQIKEAYQFTTKKIRDKSRIITIM